MRISQIKTPEDLVNYIMHEYETTGAFTLRELEDIKDSYEKWATVSFDILQNLKFEHLDRMIAHGIRVLRAKRIMSVVESFATDTNVGDKQGISQ